MSSDIELQEALSCAREPIQFFVTKCTAVATAFDLSAMDEELGSVLREIKSLNDSVDGRKRKLELEKERAGEEKERKIAEQKTELETELQKARAFLENEQQHKQETKLLQEMEKKLSLEEKEKKKSINNWIQYKARNGKMVLLDLSDGALKQFGVSTHQRVDTPNGLGTVLGVDQEQHLLWLLLDKDISVGASYWDDIKDYDSMICKGVIPTGESFDIFQPKVEMSQNLPHSFSHIKDLSERDSMMKAVQQSLIETRQTELKDFYEAQIKKKWWM